MGRDNIVLEFLREVPNITIINKDITFNIYTVQYYYEDEDRVVLKCAEHVPQFKRGFTCDMDCNYVIVNNIMEEQDIQYQTQIKDLVLVYINKVIDSGTIPEFEYVFYK